jgi:flagellin
MFRINTNVLAINGQRNLGQTARDLNTRMERLSSGLRINRAADDAAGLTAAEGMRSQLAGLRTSNDNISRGISLLQTADSSLSQIANMFTRLKELAVQASDGTLNSTNRAAIVTEATELVTEIERLSENAKYNGIDLINDENGIALTFFVGDGSASTQVVEFLSRGIDVEDSAITGDASATNFAGTVAATTAGVITGTATTLITQGLRAGDAVELGGTNRRLTIDSVNGELAATFDMTLEGRISVSDENSLSLIGVGTHFTQQVKLAADTIVVTLADGTTETLAIASINSDTHITLSAAVGTGDTFTDLKGTLVMGAAPAGVTLANVDGGRIGTGYIGADQLEFEVAELATQGGALDQVSKLDAALAQIASLRAQGGSVQNRMEYSQAAVQTTIEQTASAESVIRDADFAAEASALTRSQILAQTGASMLSQANVLPQLALTLLQ